MPVIGTVPPPLTLEPLQDQGPVVAAETERVAQRDVNFGFPGLVGNVVQIQLGVGELVVHSGGDQVVFHRLQADDGFHRAGGAEQVAVHRLGGADGTFLAPSPKTVLIAIVSNLSLSGVEVPWALM